MTSVKKNILVLILASLLMLSCDKKEPERQVKSKPEPTKYVSAQQSVSMLKLVPADTIFFAGGLKPFPLQEALDLNASNFNMLKGVDPTEMLPVWKDTDKEGRRMAVQLWTDYYSTIISPENQLESWGFEENPTAISYAIGLAPVLLRISLKDVQQFNKKIDELEVKAKVTTKPETLGKATYRRYVLNETDPSVDLIVGVDDKDAVFMLDIGVDSESTVSMALGQTKPAQSLEQSGRIKALQTKYKLHPSFIGYIDHRQLITGLTTHDGNSMAKMMQKLASKFKKDEKYLNELQEVGCRNDLTAIGENWPQTVFGYTALDFQAKPARMESLMVVESNDAPLMEGLRSLRGFIPDYVRKSSDSVVFSYGIGLNPENIGPFLMKQWTEITQKQYSCSFLKEMQKSVKEQNPAMVSMATSMATGVRGIAFSLLSLTMDATEKGATPMPKDIDAVISLAAKDPALFVQTVAAMLPMLAELQIPADGTPIQLPIPIPLPFPTMAAINGSHLTVYAGKKAEAIAKGLSEVSLESSQGFMAGDIDYGKYYGLLGDTISNMDIAGGQDTQQTMKIFKAMKDAAMRVRLDMDFTDRGIEVNADVISTH